LAKKTVYWDKRNGSGGKRILHFSLGIPLFFCPQRSFTKRIGDFAGRIGLFFARMIPFSAGIGNFAA
jgi:hypothetical protein